MLTLICATVVAVGIGPEDARRFVNDAETELQLLTQHATLTGFLSGYDGTKDHSQLRAEASRIVKARALELAKQASRYDGLDLPPDIARKLMRIRLLTDVPAPADPALQAELSRIIQQIETKYVSAANGADASGCRSKDDLYKVFYTSQDSNELLAAWKEWRTHSRAIRKPYARMVEIANAGASELGFDDVGAMWRSHYDMPPEEFRGEYERLWDQVRPLYEALHCHVRAKLRERYGDLVPADGPIPAHLLGNMWAQYWTGIEPLVWREPGTEGINITKLLQARGYSPYEMILTGQRFYTSLGFDKLPPTFWERSMLVKPAGRLVNCQGSAWPIDPADGDVRLRICAEVNHDNFHMIHHELGHVYYYLAYAQQPFLFQEGASPGFHEGLGDAIGLSITPAYLRTIGLLDHAPDEVAELRYLVHTALDRIPLLAMALVVDQWRWGVFSGEIPPDRYNAEWWKLRRKYQGVSPPTPRGEQDFDGGMFYHIPFNVPYDRYFTAVILQFDFHRGLCEAAGKDDRLHRCSIYGSEAAGERLRRSLALGTSRPWPDALEQLTGRREMDASSVIDYFEPVMTWLEQENKGRKCGW